MQFWPRATPESANRKIFRAAIIVGFLTLLAKAASTVKELMVARTFGRSDAIDAFLIAYLLPSFLVTLVAGAFGSALIPALAEARQKQGAEAAQKLLSSVMILSLLALVGIALLLVLLAPHYLACMGSGFSPAKLGLTRELLYAIVPFILFSGFAGCASAALNSAEKFALPALVPLLTPLTTMLLIAFAPGRWGPFLLAVGVVAGSILEAALLAAALRAQETRLKWRWNGLSPDVRSVLGQCVPLLAGSFLMSSTGVVDQSMAAMLSPGSVAALTYGNKIVGVGATIAATALSTAAFPYVSRMVAQKDWDGCGHTLKRYSLLVVSATVPFTLLLIAFSRPLVRLLFQRGAFTNADTQLVSWVQVSYSIQIPFYVWSSLFVRFLYSIRRNDVLVYAAGINLILDVVLNLILMRRFGVAGLALSTSLVYVFSFLFVTTWSVRLLGQYRSRAGNAMKDGAAVRTEVAR